jgi:hypothetical protein
MGCFVASQDPASICPVYIIYINDEIIVAALENPQSNGF